MSPEDTVKLGLRSLQRGEYGKAELVFRRLLDIGSHHGPLALLLAMALIHQNKFEDAKPLLLRSLALDPAKPMTWEHLGRCFGELHLPDNALECLRRGLDIKPTYVPALLATAQALADQEKWAEVEVACRKILVISDSNFRVEYNLGLALTLQGRRPEALAHLRRCLVGGLSASTLPLALLLYGQALMDHGLMTEAIGPLQWSLRLLPELAPAQIALAALQSSASPLPCFPEPMRVILESVDYQGGAKFAPEFAVFADLSAKPFAHFITANVFAATVKQQFRNGRLTVRWNPDAAYKSDIVAINSHIDEQILGSSDEAVPPAPWQAAAADSRSIEAWRQSLRRKIDFFVPPAMVHDWRLAAFEHPARLKIPVNKTAELSDRLAALGIDPQRWLCTLHFREPGWQFWIANKNRDMSPRDYEQLTHRIIRDLGGQVARLGHPGMTPFAPIEGYVDLSNEPTLTQAFAVSISRFLVTSPSGPSTLGCSFHVPTLMTNAIELTGVWRRQDCQLTQHLIAPGGKRISQSRALKNGMFSSDALKFLIEEKGYVLARNSVQEMVAAVRLISEENADVAGWRAQGGAPKIAPPHRLIWPLPIQRPWRMLEFPELAPRLPVLD